MLRRIYTPVLLCTLVFISCTDENHFTDIPEESQLEQQLVTLYGSLDELTMPLDGDYQNIPQDPKNPITSEKVALGQLLFHETGLALSAKKEVGMGTYSCASCHHAKAGFQSGVKQGLGEGGIGFGSFGEGRTISPDYDSETADIQPIRSPSAMNAAYQKVMLWNGQFGATGVNTGTESQWTPDTPKEANTHGFEGLETQAIAGLDVHRLKCEPEMIIDTPYQAYFDAAYPNIPQEERYGKLQAALAIAAYERTLLASESPFQQWLRGDETAMTYDQKKGAELFFGKANCFACHSGPGLNGMGFHALGMNDLQGSDVLGEVDEATTKGRGGFTGNAADDYKFKTPTLYNLKDVKFLGHGSSFGSVADIIRYKNMAVAGNSDVPTSQLSEHFTPLELTDAEVRQLTQFVEDALYDANLDRYVPASLPSGNCFPVADEQAKNDMGCD
ncbi:MAG: cytochrome-c peroxidase [Flavobacteriaceae bacterium]